MHTYRREVRKAFQYEWVCCLPVVLNTAWNHLFPPIGDDACVLHAVYQLKEAGIEGRPLSGDTEHKLIAVILFLSPNMMSLAITSMLLT